VELPSESFPYGYDELVKRDKLSLDLFWIKDQSLTDTDSLKAPDILAIEIADELQTVVDLFSGMADVWLLCGLKYKLLFCALTEQLTAVLFQMADQVDSLHEVARSNGSREKTFPAIDRSDSSRLA
jgi:hypothetical protein